MKGILILPGNNNGFIERQIGLWLREARRSCGMTQAELGDRFGISYQQVQKYEAGDNRLSVSRLLGFSKAMGIAPESVFLSMGYSHHIVRHELAGHRAATISRGIRDKQTLERWLKLGECLIRPCDCGESTGANP